MERQIKFERSIPRSSIHQFSTTDKETNRFNQDTWRFVQHTPDLLCRFRTTGKIFFCNKAFGQLRSTDILTGSGSALSECGVTPETAEKWEKCICKVAADGGIADLEFFLDGRYYHTRCFPEYDRTGTIRSIWSVSRDISVRRTCEEQLRTRESDTWSLLEHTPDIIARFNRNLRYLYVNKAGERLSGIPCEKFIGKTSRELGFPKTGIHTWEEQLLKVIESTRPLSSEFSFPHRGETNFFRVHFVPELGRDGDISTVLVILHDISDLKRAQDEVRQHGRILLEVNEELRRKNDELDRLNLQLQKVSRLKTEFVSMASHELRTPLSSMIAFAQTLLSEQITLSDDERKKFLGIIESEGMRLAGLLNDLLDVTKIESGVIELRFERVDIASLVKDSLTAMKFPAEVKVNLDIPDRQAAADADKGRIRQVINNFVENALRYGRSSIHIRVVNLPEAVRVTVCDDGPGIAPHEQEKIFEKFYRTHDAKTAGKGNGLGLAIAKGIIDAHGGKIGVTCAEGQGSTFFFELPVSRL